MQLDKIYVRKDVLMAASDAQTLEEVHEMVPGE